MHEVESPRRRAPEERPQQIIEAALAVFDERGLAGARLEDIALRAGVAKGTIYLYFSNKEELFREVIRTTLVRRLEETRAAFHEPPPDTSATEQLRQYVRGWWAFLLTPEYQSVSRLVIGELHHFPELAAFYSTEVVSRGRTLVSSLVARGIERGEFRQGDPVIFARMVSSMLVSQSMWVCKQQHFRGLAPYTPDQIVEQVLDFILHALRAERTPGAGEGASHS